MMDAFAYTAQGCGGGSLDPSATSASSAPGQLLGDPYRERADFTRGMILPSPFEAGVNAQTTKTEIFSAAVEQNHFRPALERFREGDIPPATPQNKFFKFVRTTFSVSHCVEPFKLANTLLDFLLLELMASVTKVQYSKYSIKADIHAGTFAGLADADEGPQTGYEPCTLKIKMYAYGAEFAIEFRRVAGDGVTFNNVYQRACRHLKRHTGAQATIRA